MCTSYQIHYIKCEQLGLRRGPSNNIPCIDEDMQECSSARESGRSCSEPIVRPQWVNYKCPEHKGPSHEEREGFIRRNGKRGMHREVWEKKGGRPSRWEGAVCGVM
jgi:hypothetical protein